MSTDNRQEYTPNKYILWYRKVSSSIQKFTQNTTKSVKLSWLSFKTRIKLSLPKIAELDLGCIMLMMASYFFITMPFWPRLIASVGLYFVYKEIIDDIKKIITVAK